MSLIGSVPPGLEMGGRQTVNELGGINTLLVAFVFCVCSACNNKTAANLGN